MGEYLLTPNPSARGGLFCPKTITLGFLKNIVASNKFKEEFRHYIENNFIHHQHKNRKSKINKVITASKKYIRNGDEILYDELIYYVEHNPKCKLPWSDKELLIAKKHVLDKIKERSDDYVACQYQNMEI